MIVLNSLLMACEWFFSGGLVLAIALLFSQGKPASERHLILTGAFAVLLALPLASFLLPSHFVWHLPTAPQTAMVQTVLPVMAMPQSAVVEEAHFDWGMVVLGIAVLWAMGAIFVLSKAAYGAVALGALYRASVPYIPEGLSGAKFEGLSWQLRIRTMQGGAGPITWGIFRPIVLLPKSSVTWSRARLEAVLLHEAAHVRRRDCLSRLIALIACAFYWPNPLVWIAARIMRRDGETAADDAVLTTGIKASAYAEHLVGLARAFSSLPSSYAGVSLAMAEPAMLDARVEAILNPTRSRKAITKEDVVKIAILGLTATAVMALARPSLAEATPVVEHTRVVENVAVAPVVAPVRVEKIRHVVRNDAPEAPEEPADMMAPGPDEPPAPPPPPALPARPMPPTPPSHITMRVTTPDGVKEMRFDGPDAEERARTAAAAMEGEQRRHASVEMRVNLEKEMRAHAAEFAQVKAELAKAGQTVHAALVNAHISEVASKAVNIAMEKAFKDAERAFRNAKVDVTVKMDGDDQDSDEN